MTVHDPRSFLQMLEEGAEAHCTAEPFLARILTDWEPVGTRRMQWVCSLRKEDSTERNKSAMSKKKKKKSSFKISHILNNGKIYIYKKW